MKMSLSTRSNKCWHRVLGDGSNTILSMSSTTSEQPNYLTERFIFVSKLQVAFPALLTACPSVLALPNIAGGKRRNRYMLLQ